MNQGEFKLSVFGTFIVLLLFSQRVFAQGYGGPLTMQGLDRSTVYAATSRAVGGTTIGVQNDVGLMFQNPASLRSLKGIQISIGGLRQYARMEQTQQYAPLKYYSNFSLLMEGLTDQIPNPRTELGGSSPGDTVQRPYDKIGPNWSRSNDRGLPLQALLAVPFSIGDFRMAAGIGVVDYADLDHYYQNNNILSPSILSQRPSPTPRPPNDLNPTIVQWSQQIRSREGWIYGYGIALSGALSDDLSFGVAGMILNGSTDDFERHTGRGRLTFYTNYFRLDSVYKRITKTGTSDYSGQEFTLSGQYAGRAITIGLNVKPPMTVKRSFTSNVETDTTGVPSKSAVKGKDEMQFPWRGTVGLSLMPTERLRFALEYDIRPYGSALYRATNGAETNPWLSSSMLHVGAEYTLSEWLVVRGGIRGRAEVFEAEGNPIVGEPVSHRVYTAGVGISYAGVKLNVAYEYSLMKYQDVWGSAISLNQDRRQTIMAGLSYELPW